MPQWLSRPLDSGPGLGRRLSLGPERCRRARGAPQGKRSSQWGALVVLLSEGLLPVPYAWAQDVGPASASVLQGVLQPLGAEEQLIFDGAKMPDGWFMASDPDLAKINDTWFMFLTSIAAATGKLHILAASLPPGEGLGAEVSKWTILRDGTGKIISIIFPGKSRESWDRDAVETADFVQGYDPTQGQWVHRVYYTGWTKSGDDPDYRIGFAQWNGHVYAKHPSPVLTGVHEWEKLNGKSLVGDQAVFFVPGQHGEGGTWHMYYQANASSPTPAVRLIHATSSDGVHWPPEQRRVVSTRPPFPSEQTPNGPYHVGVTLMRGRYHFIGWTPAKEQLNRQGLWLTTASTPDGSAPNDFSSWHPVIFDLKGASWHDSGPEDARSHETGLFGATLQEDDGQLWLFYHGVAKRHRKPWASIGRALVRAPPK